MRRDWVPRRVHSARWVRGKGLKEPWRGNGCVWSREIGTERGYFCRQAASCGPQRTRFRFVTCVSPGVWLCVRRAELDAAGRAVVELSSMAEFTRVVGDPDHGGALSVCLSLASLLAPVRACCVYVAGLLLWGQGVGTRLFYLCHCAVCLALTYPSSHLFGVAFRMAACSRMLPCMQSSRRAKCPAFIYVCAAAGGCPFPLNAFLSLLWVRAWRLDTQLHGSPLVVWFQCSSRFQR